METHSENRGKLGDKFQDFKHDPAEAVWDRIAATPTDRPLGANFRSFTWMPGSHVWKGVVSQLYPQQPWRILAGWSVAASVVVLLGVGLFWRATPASRGTAAQFAASEWRIHWGQRQAMRVPPVGKGIDQQGAGPATDIVGRDAAGSHKATPSARQETSNSPVAPVPFSNGSKFASRETPGFPQLAPLASKGAGSVLPSSVELDRRILFWQTMAVERAQEASMAHSAEGSSLPEAQEPKQPQLVAQAGSSLSTGNVSFPAKQLEVLERFDSDPVFSPASAFGDSEDHGFFGLTNGDGENYRTPLVIGASVDRPLGKGFGLSLGLVYSKLTSYVDGAGGNFTQQLNKTRQYLGLAANCNYTIPIRKRLATYASAGFQFDKGLVMNTGLDTRAGSTLLGREFTKGPAGDFASANMGLGLRYEVFRRVGLYAQGTVGHYFFHTKQNLWTNQTLWPSAQVGIRVGI